MANRNSSRLQDWTGPFYTCSGAQELFDHYAALCHHWSQNRHVDVASALTSRAIKGSHEGRFRPTTTDGHVWAYQADIPLAESDARVSVLFPNMIAHRDKPLSLYVRGEVGEDEIVDLIRSLLAEARKMLGEPVPDIVDAD